jgi:hypothetical protein
LKFNPVPVERIEGSDSRRVIVMGENKMDPTSNAESFSDLVGLGKVYLGHSSIVCFLPSPKTNGSRSEGFSSLREAEA